MSKRPLTFPLLLLFGALCFASVWAISSKPLETESARELFLKAESSLTQGEMQTYARLKARLENYPLLPYLEYQEVRRVFHTLDSDDVRTALAKLSNTPLRSRLLRDWLQTLAEQARWEEYLQFSSPGGGITQQCHRLHALIETGEQQRAFEDVAAIWLHGHSRPKACDPVFEAWIAAGHLRETLVWQRIELAMRSGQIRLARYLQRFLPPEERTWAIRWIDLYLNPSNPEYLLQERHPYRDEILVQTLTRMARTEPAKGFAIWRRIHTEPGFTDRQHLSVVRTLASYLTAQHDDNALQRLRDLLPEHLRLDSKLSDKRFQAALKQQNWFQVLEIIDNLAPKERGEERWRYWQARALMQLGRNEAAEKIFQSLSNQRSYYGFLAADRLGLRFNFLHETLPVSDSQVSRVAEFPGLMRARELLALERPLDARREWNLALQDKSAQELMGAAKLAQVWNWPSQAILALAKLRYWNDLELRFPLNYRQQVVQQARDHGLESAWIYAILRQESAFITDARSRAGALGLMQLLPTTAKEVASNTKLQAFDLDDLLQPQINIELGTRYLNQIYRKLQENPVLATAAYNAGPRRVMNWLPEQSQATDVWIETVPYRETRKYLKRVLAYMLIYNHRLGNTPDGVPEKWLEPIQSIHFYTKQSIESGSDV